MRHAAGGDADVRRSWPRAISDLTGGQRVPRLRAVARARRHATSSRSSTASSGSAARWPSSARRRASARSSGGGSPRLRPATSDLLELAAVGRRGVRPRRAAAAAAERGGRCSARSTRPSRSGMIEELPSRAARLPVHARAGPPRALRRPHRGAARGAAPARRRGARARPGSRPPAGRPRAPLRGRRAARRRRRAASRTTCSPRAPRPPRWPSTRRPSGCAIALELGVDEPARARRAAARARGRAAPRGPGGRRARGVRARRRRSPASSATRSCSPRAAIGYEDACWRPVITDRCAVELLERAAAALGRGAVAAARRRARRAGPRARRSAAHHARGARGPRGGRRDGPARSATARRSRRCSSAATGRAGRSAPEEVLAMLTEARDLAAELGDVGPADGGDELARAALLMRSATSRRHAARSPPCARRPSGPRSRSTSTSPSTAARRSRCARAGWPTPRRWPQRSHEWSRLLTGRDASGVYGIQMFSVRREQGRLARARAGDPAARRRAGHGGPWRPGLASLLAELGHGGRGAARAGARRRRRARRVPRLAVARVADLPDATRARRWATRRWPRCCTPSWSRSRARNVMIGHVVACYGAADRYLGHARRDARRVGARRSATSSAAMALNRRMGALTWLAHTALRVRAHAARARRRRARPRRRRCSARRTALAERIGMPALLAPRSAALGTPRAGRRRCPDGLSFREVQILGLVAAGLSNREIGSDAVHQRAHGREPHPQHPAQDALREPDRGGLLRAPPRPGRGLAAAVRSARCRCT